MRNFRIQDRVAPNLSCATGLSVDNLAHPDLSKTFFSNLLEGLIWRFFLT